MSRTTAMITLLLCAACQRTPRAHEPPAQNVVSSPASPASERRFGAPITEKSGHVLDVADVLAHPEAHINQVIQCRGTVARVCEAAGCWLELRAPNAPDKTAQGLRVPMAGHRFFVPQDVVGRSALVEGHLSARQLTQAELDHLQGEGLRAIGPLSLAATGIVIR